MRQHSTARRTKPLVLLLIAVLGVASACSPSTADKPPASSANAATSASPEPQALRYVALGDSFASAPLVPVTDVANGCFRSSNNYPSLVARKLGADLDDHSCGGAETADLSTSQFPEVPAQLPAVTPDVDLVTIGIGGNDEGLFTQLTRKCPELRASDPEGAPCQAFMSSRGSDVLLAKLKRTRASVTTVLEVAHRQAPRAKVLVVGYPQIVSADNACTKLPLARGDYAYAAGINLALNDALRQAARATGSTYVDVYAASKGHDVCSDDPWVNGSVNDQKRAAAYHPFAEEQQAVADLVVAAAKG
ncbi:MAG: hydrolase family protein [Marmoricola sp.]|nr:hydrolase family protein [Marmoricola sp.]